MELRLTAAVVVTVILLSQPLGAETLREQYLNTKSAGLTKVYSDYFSELEHLRQTAASAGAVEEAIAIDDEIKVVQQILGQIESGEPLIHIGKFDDSQERSSGNLRAVKNRSYERIREALKTLDEQYIRRSGEAMQIELKQQDFEKARLLKEFHDELLAARSSGREIDLFANSDDWIEVKGDWKFDGSKVVGEGDSELLYQGPELPESFTLTVDIRVKSGVRPRIYLGEYTVSNIDPKKFVLFPKQKTNLDKNFYSWDHLKTHRVRISYGPRHIELYIDETLVEKHVEPTQPVKRLSLSAGDYYSKGEVVFSNVRLRQGL
ncbi:MAG: hypothetical protein P1U81_08155 [Verrucomicrobiales bacterium]|jgi:hypothetical protein|nr:hypothetical protein [Verrucomicrobiales bacterium]